MRLSEQGKSRPRCYLLELLLNLADYSFVGDGIL